jgi:DNA-binding transcriptional regulator YiaG
MSDESAPYGSGRTRRGWDAQSVRALRLRLGFSQQQFAGELGVRQQTVSEWETGRYTPRGATARLLGIVAERAEQRYQPDGASDESESGGQDAEGSS